MPRSLSAESGRAFWLVFLLWSTSCSLNSDGNPPLETDNCVMTTVLFESGNVRQGDGTGLKVSARLVTDAGEPLPQRVLIFSVRDAPDEGASKLLGAKTDEMGAAAGDLTKDLFPGGIDERNLRSATRIVASYENPDALNGSAQPNYCSSNTEIDFEYVEPSE